MAKAKTDLVIVESPAKARTIEKYLGGNYHVVASMGHLRDLPKSTMGVDIDGVGVTRPNTTGLPTRIIRSHWNLGPTLDFDPQRAARNIDQNGGLFCFSDNRSNVIAYGEPRLVIQGGEGLIQKQQIWF